MARPLLSLQENDMEVLTIIATVFLGFASLGVLAITKGADSREGIGDDWKSRVRI
jgi:hypothetical protein